MKATRQYPSIVIAAMCVFGSIAAHAAPSVSTSAPRAASISQNDDAKAQVQAPQTTCNSFYDALHMNESLDAYTRNAGLACLNALNERAKQRRPIKPEAPLAVNK